MFNPYIMCTKCGKVEFLYMDKPTPPYTYSLDKFNDELTHFINRGWNIISLCKSCST